MATTWQASRPSPPGVDGDDTRRKILEVARSCFAAYGYTATTNRMIRGWGLGVTSASLYHYFGQKHELMLAVHQASYTRYLEQLREGRRVGRRVRWPGPEALGASAAAAR